MKVSLSLTAAQHDALSRHLFPGDGCEAVALALCGRWNGGNRHRLLVKKIIPVPYEACSVRTPDRVTWSTELLPSLLEQAARSGLALVKIHGHGEYQQFSATDDASDRALFPSVYVWTDTGAPHASVIMMRDGSMFGRVVDGCGSFEALDRVSVVGDDLKFWLSGPRDLDVEAFGVRIAQSFGAGTYGLLRKLRVAVVGCSGTGSVIIEQLARNCVGALVLVDPDRVEHKNLNRILNATRADAEARLRKVEVAARAIAAMSLGTQVETYDTTVFDREAAHAVAGCDIVFGCVDTVDGRHLLNKLATFYVLPYFDVGVRLDADGRGGVQQVAGTVHYLLPGGSSLLSRHVYTQEQLRAAGLYRSDPATYRSLLNEGYIRGIYEDRPAVVQLNSLIASLAINELLARLHPYRIDPNADYAVHRLSLSHGIYEHHGHGPACTALQRHVGRGDVEPLLDWPELSAPAKAP